MGEGTGGEVDEKSSQSEYGVVMRDVQRAIVVAVVVAVVGLLALAGGNDGDQHRQVHDNDSGQGQAKGGGRNRQATSTQLARPSSADVKGSVDHGEGPLYGLAIQLADTQHDYTKEIREIATLGANSVTLCPAAYQEHAGSQSLFLDVRLCPTRETMAEYITTARRLGLRVVLQPVILLSNPRGNEWRGRIQPPDWDRWFADYLAVIKHFAHIGQDYGAEVLLVGAELISTETEAHLGRWRKLIAEVRPIFKGRLAYSSNWDHYHAVKFWDDLDMIGMTTYHKLADKEDPELETLLASWAGIKQEVLSFQARYDKPILFTEVGWCSQPGASIEAWNYYRHQKASKVGLREQLRLYKAFMKTWSDVPQVGGIIWWEWTTGDGGLQDYGYTPKGKPAEQLLRQWFARMHHMYDVREDVVQ